MLKIIGPLILVLCIILMLLLTSTVLVITYAAEQACRVIDCLIEDATVSLGSPETTTQLILDKTATSIPRLRLVMSEPTPAGAPIKVQSYHQVSSFMATHIAGDNGNKPATNWQWSDQLSESK